MRWQKKTGWLIFSLLLSACTVGPNYVQPKIEVPAKYKEASPKKGWKTAQPRDGFDRGQWWEIFHDRRLSALEQKLVISNQTIATAEAQYRQARALVDEARAGFYPTLIGGISLARQKQVSGTADFTSATSTGISSGSVVTGGHSSGSNVFTNHSWALDATWEPDLWGSVRRTVEASAAGAEASAAQLASVRLSSQATLAQTYFQLRALDKDQEILDNTVVEFQKALTLTQHRYTSGVAARSDVIQAQTQLDNARAQAINNHIGRAQFEHAIAVLLGEAPANFSIPREPLTGKPPAIPLAVPSALLERRPDVAQAERLAAQANAQIGIAIAAYYPSLTLNAAASEQHRGYAPWFSVPAIGWSLSSELAQTIFDGGLRDATTAAARANYEATVASYRQVVLTAFQDVEDNLASLNYLQKQAIAQNKAAADALLALRLMLNQYKAGTVAYSDVIVAQTTAYTAEKAAADITGQRMTAAVGLVKALGGGWLR